MYPINKPYTTYINKKQFPCQTNLYYIQMGERRPELVGHGLLTTINSRLSMLVNQVADRELLYPDNKDNVRAAVDVRPDHSKVSNYWTLFD